MPADYVWTRDTVSESAAQGLDGAWLARTGLLVLGLAVICTAAANRRWSRPAQLSHHTFGALMITAAVFSSRAADPATPYIRT